MKHIDNSSTDQHDEIYASKPNRISARVGQLILVFMLTDNVFWDVEASDI